MASSVTTTGNPSQRTVATGTGSEVADNKDHSCQEMIRLLKETLKYRTGNHHTFFVFGATLDFALKKIYPTLWTLYRYWLMPKKTAIVGYARSTLTVAQFRVHISKYIKLKDAYEEELFDQFLQHNVYVQGKYNEPEDFKRLGKTVEMLEQTVDDGDAVENNRLFYLGLPPSVIEPVADLIDDFLLSKSGWNRVIIENPFGNHSESCEKLSRHIQSLYNKEEPYHIHQYLINEMALNLSKSPGMTIRLDETELDLSDTPESFQDFVHHYPQDLHFPGAYERSIMCLFGWSQNATLIKSLHKQTRDLLKTEATLLRGTKESQNQPTPEPSEAGQMAAETNATGSDHPSTSAIDDIGQPEKHLNALPDVPLRLIFSYLPLQDVLQMRRVCRFWQSYQSSIVSKVKSLTLLLGQPDFDDLHFDYEHKQQKAKLVNDDGSSMYPVQPYDHKSYQVRYRLIRHDTILFLLFTLPNISTLQIHINGLSYVALRDVRILISFWSSKLTTFKLWCAFCEEDCRQLTSSVLLMLNRINSMTALKHLTLNIQHKLYPVIGHDEDEFADVSPLDEQLLGVVPHFDLSILSRLREFNFNSDDFIEHTPLFYFLEHFVPSNPSLTHIAIHNQSWNNAIWPLAQRCPNGASRITSLTAVEWDDGLDLELNPMAVQPILSEFTSLTELTYRHNPMVLGFIQLVNIFSPLRMLVRLHLILSFGEKTQDLIYFPQDDNRPHSEISQLISVKMLSLEVDTQQDHTQIESVHWGWTFPNVQVIEWFNDSREPVNFDVDQLAPTFLQFGQLRHIFVLNQECTEWTVMETDGVKSIRRA